ncbi:hypothetical protein FQR65_LT01834 [Abscondita terminalis]|nr:hypothetical protein FQR65_LT01834 [Abscondita terminalis]
MIPNYHLLTVFCFISTIQVSTSLKCFICTSKLDVCSDPYNKSAHTSEICDESTPVCLKEIFSGSGTSKKCYICTTFVKSENCSDPFNKEGMKEDVCDINNYVCLKEKSNPTGAKDHIFRGCVSPDYCTAPGKRTSSFCETCDSDLCNTGSSLTYSFLSLPLFLVVNILI